MDASPPGKIVQSIERRYTSTLILALIVFGCTFITSTSVYFSGILYRAHLQTINQRFELRNWLLWNAESLSRLDFGKILDYHEKHDIPKNIWFWDYTLSWLIENNHPPVKHKFVIFNHSLEDEPPDEAIKALPWMAPLKERTLSRKDLASVIEYLAHADVQAIIIDYEFPQYTDGDKQLAKAIFDCSNGKLIKKKIPVFFVRSVHRGAAGSLVKVSVPGATGGVLEELEKLEPGTDVAAKYTGITGVWQDEDQVVRRLANSLSGSDGTEYESLASKLVKQIDKDPNLKLPATFDIDFSAPPNSALYPVRPQHYLFDPELKEEMKNPSSKDVTLKDSIVLIGDSVSDVFNTPTTSLGLSQMSGTELLAHSIDTISRKSFPYRVAGWQAVVWFLIVSLCAAILFSLIRCLLPIGISFESIPTFYIQTVRDISSLFCGLFIFIVVSCLLFAYGDLLVPMMSPLFGIVVGNICALVWEKEQERFNAIRFKLKSAEHTIELQRQVHKVELDAQAAHAEALELMREKEIRKEFARKVEHDLRAPIGVLNWTILRLAKNSSDNKNVMDNVERLRTTSDRLNGLLDELMQSYELRNHAGIGADDKIQEEGQEFCDLNEVVSDCCKLLNPLAMDAGIEIENSLNTEPVLISVRRLEISRVLDNLIKNSIFHNAPGTVVTVKVSAGLATHCAIVSDNGKGIHSHALPNIFNAGFRINDGSGMHKEGQGLGLHIVKTIVDNFKGTIEVESRLAEHTTFIVRVPALRKKDDLEIESVSPQTTDIIQSTRNLRVGEV